MSGSREGRSPELCNSATARAIHAEPSPAAVVGRPVEPVLRVCGKCRKALSHTIVRVLTKCPGCGKIHDHPPEWYAITGVRAEGGELIPMGEGL